MTKEEHIENLQTMATQKDLDDSQYAWGDALFTLRDVIGNYCHEFKDDVPDKMFSKFITEDEATEMAQKYIDNDNLIGLRRFLVGSVLYNGIYKLDEHNELEDTTPEEMFEVRDKIIQYIRDSDK